MNKGLLSAFVGIICGGLGYFAGYFFTKKKYITLADREIESMKSKQKEHDIWLLNLYGVKEQPEEDNSKQKSSTTITPSTVKPGVDRLEAEKAAAQKQYKDYTTITKKYGDFSKGEESQPTVLKESKSDIFVITEREFDESDYSYSELHYYINEGIITDADDNAISNYAKIVGPSTLWSDYLVSNNAVYVRNTVTRIDYEILKCEGSWNGIASPAQKASVINAVGEADDDD